MWSSYAISLDSQEIRIWNYAKKKISVVVTHRDIPTKIFGISLKHSTIRCISNWRILCPSLTKILQTFIPKGDSSKNQLRVNGFHEILSFLNLFSAHNAVMLPTNETKSKPLASIVTSPEKQNWILKLRPNFIGQNKQKGEIFSLLSLRFLRPRLSLRIFLKPAYFMKTVIILAVNGPKSEIRFGFSTAGKCTISSTWQFCNLVDTAWERGWVSASSVFRPRINDNQACYILHLS